MNTKIKFGVIITIVVGTIAWLAATGVGMSSSYYKTVVELQQMGDRAQDKRLRVAGDVAEGTVRREGQRVSFQLKEHGQLLPVVYDGIDPLPDTFRDGAQAVCDGKLGTDGVFHATKLQAKCASKYEKKFGERTSADKAAAVPANTSASKPASY